MSVETVVAARPSRRAVWLLAVRVPTLPAAVTPILVGSAYAWGTARSFRFDVFVAALVTSLLLQIAANLANDYFDHRKGADTDARLGPPRVTQRGWLAPGTVRTAIVVVLGLSMLSGLYLIAVGGLALLIIGACAIAAAVLYTGGPWPFGYHALGELFVFVFFGLVAVAGTSYLHIGAFSWLSLIVAAPVGALATAMLVVNNLRDLDTDRIAGKRTLGVRLGDRGTRVEYALLVAAAYLVPVGLWLAGTTPLGVVLPVVTLPVAVALLRRVGLGQGPALNRVLRDTARLHLLFGVCYAVGLLL